MTIERKVGMGIAGQPSGGATDVAEVFSTDLYDGTYYNGNGLATTVNNGIDLDGEGGLVWLKSRVITAPPALYDTERGANSVLFSSTNNAAESGSSDVLGSFTSTGFVTEDNPTTNGAETASANSGNKFVSWTFRKKSGFFDCVTYTGNGVQGREIAHGLAGPVGMILVKSLNFGGVPYDWSVYHQSAGGTKRLKLNSTDAEQDNDGFWYDTNATSTHFTVGNAASTNSSGKTYVAYLFADNSSEDAEEQMIKCGSYTGTAADLSINLGWEAQFVLVKNISSARDWRLVDSMRGAVTGGYQSILAPNTNAVEQSATDFLHFNSLGFELYASGGADVNSNGDSYIYMAIRAPMMVEPEAATDVFGITTRNVANDNKAPEFRNTFPVDMALRKWDTSDPTQIVSRLTQGRYLTTNSSNTEQASSTAQFDYNNGWSSNATSANTTLHSWMWKRAKGYMDVVAYSGTGANRTLPHSLSVVPEMIWVKSRTTTEQWVVYHSSMTLSVGTSPPHRIISYLNLTNRPATNQAWDNTAPTDSVFSIGTPTTVNQSNIPYIAYLFATLDGVSKCGGYTGNGSSQTISCGFSAGSRFVLIHRTDDPEDNGISGSWYVWDSVRGIVAGNDPHFSLHTNNGDITNDDSVDPHNSGFIVNQNSATNINVSSGDYIFYAIA